MKFPNIDWVAEKVMDYRDYLKTLDPKDIEDEEGNIGGDIRLQVRKLENSNESSWSVHTGDSSYDQDHRGEWGANFVLVNATDAECREIAKDLIEQAKESFSQNIID